MQSYDTGRHCGELDYTLSSDGENYRGISPLYLNGEREVTIYVNRIYMYVTKGNRYTASVPHMIALPAHCHMLHLKRIEDIHSISSGGQAGVNHIA